MMQRYVLVASLFSALSLITLPSGPTLAVTPKQKMETCKFGADHPMLAGKARADFIKKCMSEKNDPRGPSSSDAPGAPSPEGKPN
jgi:hypothetical protein